MPATTSDPAPACARLDSEAQATARLRRVRGLGAMLEAVRGFKEQEHEEQQAMLQNNALLELKLRKLQQDGRKR